MTLEELLLLVFFIGCFVLVLVLIFEETEETYEWTYETIYQEITPYECELLVAKLYEDKGYSVSTTKQTADDGVDLFASKRGVSCAIDVKQYKNDSNKVGSPEVRSIIGAAQQFNKSKGVIVTTSFFTSNAQQTQEKMKSNSQMSVGLINQDRLLTELQESSLDATETIKELKSDN